jgi:hypothetical protein
MNHNGSWLGAGEARLRAQRRRSALLDQREVRRLRGIDSAPAPILATTDWVTLAAAAKKHSSDCEKPGTGT